jgi:sortase (surface protein transpeptidase)
VAAAGLIAAGAVVLGICVSQSSGPPQPGAGAARPGARPPQASGPVLGASQPVRVDIPRLGVHAPLISLGLTPDGSVAVPSLKQARLAGWYDQGPTPGEVGPAVLLGHVDSKKGPAVFFELGRARPGDRIDVTRKDRTVAAFTVDSVERVAKAQFPTNRVYGDLTYAGIRLITCGGGFDGHHYTGNVIVYGHLAGAHPS